MSREIEAKIKVPTLAPFDTRLKELEADFVHTVHQTDIYFMDTAGRLRKNDCALRIRKQVIDSEFSALITFKGPRANGKFKNRTEYETAIADTETGVKIFESLGYQKKITVEKKRMIWRLDKCEICLDELPELGCFVEVEGPGEDIISGVLEKLNLHDEPHISKGYAAMMSRKLKQE